MSALDEAPLVQPEDRAAWRAWLAEHHATSRGVWLVTWRRGHGTPLTYAAIIEEALCFGWVDGQARRIDDRRTGLYLSPRRRGSTWAGTNKARVERLMAAGRMEPAGIAPSRAARGRRWRGSSRPAPPARSVRPAGSPGAAAASSPPARGPPPERRLLPLG